MSINLCQAYAQALAQKYATGMYFGALFTTPNNARYKILEGNVIKIPKITVNGRTDGDRDTIGGFERNHGNEWETKTLTNHRQWKTLEHPQNIIQSNMVLSIQNITEVMNTEEKIPEKQKYLVSKILADWKALGNTADTTALTADNVLTKIDEIAEAMDEASVPVSGRMLYVTPSVNTLIKNAKQLSRYLGATDNAIVRSLGRIDDFTIVSVPSDLMKSVYDFTQGATSGAGAKQIYMFAVHPLSVYTPENYTYVGLQEPTTLTQGKWAYFEEAFEDVFIINERAKGIKFVMGA